MGPCEFSMVQYGYRERCIDVFCTHIHSHVAAGTLLEQEEGVEVREDLHAGLVDGADDAAPRPGQPLQEAHHQQRGAGVEAWWVVVGLKG